MAVRLGGALVMAIICMFAINASANKDWSTVAGNWNHSGGAGGGAFWGFWHKHNASSQVSNRFVVGGSENWRFGFNYTDWAIKTGPFFMNDTLVFKYDPPNDTTFPHNVYLLPDFWSFQNCDLRRAKKIGQVTSGAGEGFEFVLKRWQPYYFACGEHSGAHCKIGQMKFAVWPLIRWFY